MNPNDFRFKTLISCFLALTLAACGPEEEDNNSTTTTPPDANGQTSVDQNQKPVATTGENQRAQVGDTVEVSAVDSSDPDGDVLTVLWTIIPPEGSSATLKDADRFKASFVPDIKGDYTLEVVVNDGKIDSNIARTYVRVSERTEPVNTAPTANAGADAMLFLDQTLTLDGSASSDPEGDELTYKWTITSSPQGATASIEDPTLEQTALLTDMPGEYTLELVVSDAELDSAPDDLVLTIQDVTPTNTAPVADAGPDLMVNAGETVTLDGSQSFDLDGDELSAQWTLISSPADSIATITDDAMLVTSFVPDLGGSYEFTLVVSDGLTTSATDRVVVTVADSTISPPVAVSSVTTAFVPLNEPFQLDGSASFDDDGDALTYRWLLISKPAGSLVLLDGATTATPTLTPDVEGDYVIELTVNDGIFDSRSVLVTLTASLLERPCLIFSEYIEGSANNKAFEIYSCGTGPADLTDVKVCLISNNDTTCGNTEALSGALAAGDVLGFCHKSLAISVMPGACDFDETTVANFNGNDRLLIFLDRDGDGQPNTSLDVLDAFGNPAMVPGNNPWAEVTLQRCDFSPFVGGGSSNPFDISFDVTRYRNPMAGADNFADLGTPPAMGGCGAPMNRAPQANPGTNRTVVTGSQVMLSGANSSDPDGDPLTYLWSLTSAPTGSTAMLMNAATQTPTLTPDLDGDYVLSLVVNDGMSDSAPATLTLTSGPTVSQPGDCFKISEYIEGSSNNKAVELYNCGTTDIDLTPIKLCQYNGGGTSCFTGQLDLTGTLAPQGVIGVCSSQLDMTKVDATDCDYTSSVANFNGDDRLVLYVDADGDGKVGDPANVLDAFGELATPAVGDPWKDKTLRRCDFTTYYNGTTTFDLALLYEDAGMIDDFSQFGDAPAPCTP